MNIWLRLKDYLANLIIPIYIIARIIIGAKRKKDEKRR